MNHLTHDPHVNNVIILYMRLCCMSVCVCDVNSGSIASKRSRIKKNSKVWACSPVWPVCIRLNCQSASVAVSITMPRHTTFYELHARHRMHLLIYPSTIYMSINVRLYYIYSKLSRRPSRAYLTSSCWCAAIWWLDSQHSKCSREAT